MDAIERLEKATAHAATKVAAIKPDQLSLPTPCAELDVRGLLNHLFAGLEMMTSAAQTGKGTVDPNVDRVADDPGGSYAKGCEQMLNAFRAEDVMSKTLEMPFGAMPGENVAGIAFMEQLIHSWDIAKATGQDATLPEDLATECLEAFTPMDAMLRGPGVFGPKVEVAEDAPTTERLVAFAGRKP